MPDVIVVGAGIVGTAIAFEAVKVGARVTLVDRGPIAAQGASRFGFGALSWSAAASAPTPLLCRLHELVPCVTSSSKPRNPRVSDY